MELFHNIFNIVVKCILCFLLYVVSYPYILFFLHNLTHLLLLGFTFTCTLNSSYWFRTFSIHNFPQTTNVAKSIFLSQNFGNNISTSHFSVV